MSSTSPTDPPAKTARFRRYLVRVFFIAACLLTLIVAFFLEEKIRGRAAWRAYEKEAKARGVKLDFADYIPPQIPDAENFASIPIFDAVIRASDAKKPVPNPLKLPEGQPLKFGNPVKQERIDLAAWQTFFIESKLLPAAGESPASDVLKALDGFAAPLAQLREAGVRPHCCFPVHWELAFAAQIPHLQILKSAAKLYALRLSAHLALGDSAAAYEDFHDGLRLTTATVAEPSLIAGLVSIATATLMENAVWGGLADHRWAEPELRRIEADLATLDWLKAGLFAMGSERGGENLMTDMLIENPGQLDGILGSDAPSGYVGFRFYPTGWFYQNKVRWNRYFDEVQARFEPEHHRYFGGRTSPSSFEDIKTGPKRIYYLLFALRAPALESVEKNYVHAATVTDHARLACALERFRIARGSFPQALSELTPDFLARIPAEVVNGEPYRYRRTDDGSFLLHSVGLDLRDDGDTIDPKTIGTDQADWIWRYPAP